MPLTTPSHQRRCWVCISSCFHLHPDFANSAFRSLLRNLADFDDFIATRGNSYSSQSGKLKRHPTWLNILQRSDIHQTVEHIGNILPVNVTRFYNVSWSHVLTIT